MVGGWRRLRPVWNTQLLTRVKRHVTTRSITPDRFRRRRRRVRGKLYDNAGNILTDSRSGGPYTYAYNKANRLKTVTVSGTVRGTYVYNGFEQLISRVVTNSGTANGTTYFVHDLWGNVIAELTTAGATVREYIWLPETEIAPTMQSRTQVDRPIAVVDGVNTASPATLMVHVDHLNRPVRMTNSAKASVWDVIYTPWGAFHSATGAQTLNARFPGQWFQLESGLHYNWHRHYDPSLGRYTQPDPLGFVDGPSVYAYAGNNPLTRVDPDGRFAPGAGYAAEKFVEMCAALAVWYFSPPPPPPPPRTKPETCTQDEHDRRQDEINRSCKPKPPRCTSPNPQIAAQAKYCAELRQTQISRCFGNSGGDQGHRKEVADWWELYASCR